MGMLIVMTWNIAGQSNKLEQLVAASAKMEKRFDDKDRMTEDLKVDQGKTDRRVDKLEFRVEVLERAAK